MTSKVMFRTLLLVGVLLSPQTGLTQTKRLISQKTETVYVKVPTMDTVPVRVLPKTLSERTVDSIAKAHESEPRSNVSVAVFAGVALLVSSSAVGVSVWQVREFKKQFRLMQTATEHATQQIELSKNQLALNERQFKLAEVQFNFSRRPQIVVRAVHHQIDAFPSADEGMPPLYIHNVYYTISNIGNAVAIELRAATYKQFTHEPVIFRAPTPTDIKREFEFTYDFRINNPKETSLTIQAGESVSICAESERFNAAFRNRPNLFQYFFGAIVYKDSERVTRHTAFIRELPYNSMKFVRVQQNERFELEEFEYSD